MKKSIFFLMSFFLVSCSATEANSSWITNLLSANNANYVADSSGTITMDGFTYTIAEVLSSHSAVYNVYLGEFGNREINPFGYVRFELNPDSLSDVRVLSPLSISVVTASIEAAKTASLLSGSQITTVPSAIVNSRFMANLANLSYREFETTGANAGNVFEAQVEGASPLPDTVYIRGIKTTDGNDLFFQEVALVSRSANNIISGYYLTTQWRFVKALNDTQGIYQQVKIEKFDPGDPYFYYAEDSYLFPRKAVEPFDTNPVYVGVEKGLNVLYFRQPSTNTFYTTTDAVNFSSGVSLKVGRPITQSEIDAL